MNKAAPKGGPDVIGRNRLHGRNAAITSGNEKALHRINPCFAAAFPAKTRQNTYNRQPCGGQRRWRRRTAQTADKPQQLRLENDPAAIEEAMYQLARFAAQEGLRLGTCTEPATLRTRTNIEWYIAEPVRHSCQQGQLQLLRYLRGVAGIFVHGHL